MIGQVTGRVTDAGTGVAIVHAQVDIPQWALTTTTDSAGRFTLSGVTDGRWVIRARAPGYATSLATGGDIRVHPSPVVLACPKATTVATPHVIAIPSAPAPGSLVELTVVADSATAVYATLFGQPISFTRDTTTAHRLIGLAAVPLDSTHDGSIALTYVYPNGTAAHGTAVLPVTLPPVIASAAPPRREALHVASQFAARPSGETARRVEAEGDLAHTVGTASLGTRPLWHTPFEHPRPGRVTSPFGGGRMFNGQLQSRHAGTDFAGHIGDPVMAANRGVVAMVGDFFLAGTVVYLDHGGGLTSAYFHLSAVDVAVGDTVERGQRIGAVGATGRVTGPHLHWVVRYGTVSVNPLDALSLHVPASGDDVPLCH